MGIKIPLVSIICNTYNHEKYISKAIEGFLSQKTNFAFEVLIHDDCSTDSTATIIKKYEEMYPDIIKPIYADENRYSKNILINSIYQYPRAKGKYIAFCEGDDFWTDKYKLQRQVDFLEKYDNYVGCVHKYIVVDKNGEKNDVKTFGYYDEEGRYTLKDFCSQELPSQLATLVCRNIFNNKSTEYPKELQLVKIQGDIKLYLYLLSYGDIYRMPYIMSAYRFVYEDGGASWSSKAKNNANGYKIWKGVCALEKTYKKVYGKKIKLNQRRINASVKTIMDLWLNNDKEHIASAIKVIIMQRGTCRGFIKTVKHNNEEKRKKLLR